MSDFLGHEKPPIEEALEHHGVKGMKWGVRRDRESGGGSSSSGGGSSHTMSHEEAKKAYMAVPSIKRSASEANAALTANKQKFLDKFGAAKQTKKEESITRLNLKASDLDTKISELKTAKEDLAGKKNPAAIYKRSGYNTGIRDYTKQRNAILKTIDAKERGKLTPTQKKLLIGGAVVGGLIAYGVLRQHNIIASAGKPISPQKFNAHVAVSKLKSWGISGYIQPSSFERQEFTIEAGNTFHRLSADAETSLRKGAYVTHNVDDFNRYVAGFRNEVVGTELHHITFTATKPIKIPDLTTTLETLREAMEERGYPAKPGDVRSTYESLSGGRWAFNHSIGENVSATFMDKLLEKGYSAFIDEMDAGVIGDHPLVFLDTSAVSSHTASLMSETDISTAEKSLKELTSRKI